MTRIDAVDEELLDLAARAGCVQIDYGVESGNPETLKKIHKPHTVEMVRRVIPHDAPLRHSARGRSSSSAFPGKTRRRSTRRCELMKDLSPYVVFQPAIASILIPFPGTEIYDRYKDEYGFAEWWLSDDRTYDAPRLDTHAFYQTVMYRMGVVLDADFFRYTRRR